MMSAIKPLTRKVNSCHATIECYWHRLLGAKTLHWFSYRSSGRSRKLSGRVTGRGNMAHVEVLQFRKVPEGFRKGNRKGKHD